MSSTAVTLPGRAALWTVVGDYVELTKPRIVFMVLIAVIAAAFAASWGQPHPLVLLHTLVGTLMVAASGSTMNQWIERYHDALMDRTADRPIAAGRISASRAFGFATALVVAGLLYLGLAVGIVPMLWALLTWILYSWIYTPLKRWTAWNTPVGAVAGALPIVIGWTATGAPMDLRAAGLFLILFLWQFPHFMAIAWLFREQYGRAGMQMLTVVDPSGRRAGLHAVSAALALLPVSLVPVLATPGSGAWLYAVLVMLMGVAQAACAMGFLLSLNRSAARRLLRASLLYLPALLLLLMFVPWM